MDLKAYLNIYTIAGAAAGGYVGHSKYGKKHGYTAPVVGAIGGLVAGLVVQKLVGQGAPQQLPPGYRPQTQIPQPGAGAPAQGDYVDLDGMGFVPPPSPNASSAQRAEYEASQAAYENLGSLSGNSGDGLGSLGGVPGFDADSIDYDEILGEGGGNDFN